MDELTIDGKTYVSSKRAAKISGYAKDYVGQLCREGRIESRLVGRSWYVLLDALNSHRFKEEEPKKGGAKSKQQDRGYAWESPKYSPIQASALPSLENRPSVNRVAEAPSARDLRAQDEAHEALVTQMQSAWQEWFNLREESPAEGGENSPEEEVAYEVHTTKNLENTTPIEDIEVEAETEQETGEEEVTEVPSEPVSVVRIIETKVTRREEREAAGKAALNEKEAKRQAATLSPFRVYALRTLLIILSFAAIATALIGTGTIAAIGSKAIAEIPVVNFIAGINAVK